MKQTLRVAGVMALGAANLGVGVKGVAQVAEGEATKPWNLGVGLQGFYDDNIFTRPSGLNPNVKQGSWGAQITPSVKYNIESGPTLVSLGYLYKGTYFAERTGSKWDNYHYLNGTVVNHPNEHVTLSAGDLFSITREPEEFLSGTVTRTKADSIANRATVSGTVDLSERLSFVLTYKNNFFDYDDPGYKAPLNRMEQLPALDFRYQIAPTTFGVFGYQFGDTAYDKSQTLTGVYAVQGSGTNATALPVHSNVRDNYSHYFYAGVDQNITQELLAMVRVGIQYTDFYNYKDYYGTSVNATTPYADASLKYALQSDTSLTLGIRHQRNPTDALSPDAQGNLILDQESTLLYFVGSHVFAEQWKANLSANYQAGQFKGGVYDGKTETYYSVGVGLTYSLSKNLSLNASYFYDRVLDDPSTSLSARSYIRNRVFFGLKASY